ncbi:MAG: hypothetical protein M1821_005172 [Bathelium mastoideum]|nr:MAG: hypothetical protein M1821_005172 [Bathelium mastoideum]
MLPLAAGHVADEPEPPITLAPGTDAKVPLGAEEDELVGLVLLVNGTKLVVVKRLEATEDVIKGVGLDEPLDVIGTVPLYAGQSLVEVEVGAEVVVVAADAAFGTVDVLVTGSRSPSEKIQNMKSKDFTVMHEVVDEPNWLLKVVVVGRDDVDPDEEDTPELALLYDRPPDVVDAVVAGGVLELVEGLLNELPLEKLPLAETLLDGGVLKVALLGEPVLETALLLFGTLLVMTLLLVTLLVAIPLLAPLLNDVLLANALLVGILLADVLLVNILLAGALLVDTLPVNALLVGAVLKDMRPEDVPLDGKALRDELLRYDGPAELVDVEGLAADEALAALAAEETLAEKEFAAEDALAMTELCAAAEELEAVDELLVKPLLGTALVVKRLLEEMLYEVVVIGGEEDGELPEGLRPVLGVPAAVLLPGEVALGITPLDENKFERDVLTEMPAEALMEMLAEAPTEMEPDAALLGIPPLDRADVPGLVDIPTLDDDTPMEVLTGPLLVTVPPLVRGGPTELLLDTALLEVPLLVIKPTEVKPLVAIVLDVVPPIAVVLEVTMPEYWALVAVVTVALEFVGSALVDGRLPIDELLLARTLLVGWLVVDEPPDAAQLDASVLLDKTLLDERLLADEATPLEKRLLLDKEVLLDKAALLERKLPLDERLLLVEGALSDGLVLISALLDDKLVTGELPEIAPLLNVLLAIVGLLVGRLMVAALLLTVVLLETTLVTSELLELVPPIWMLVDDTLNEAPLLLTLALVEVDGDGEAIVKLLLEDGNVNGVVAEELLLED